MFELRLTEVDAACDFEERPRVEALPLARIRLSIFTLPTFEIKNEGFEEE
jgi:hypothetical protein